jgi:ABC-type glycerol-3-phosphate transport system substrate-binding protein
MSAANKRAVSRMKGIAYYSLISEFEVEHPDVHIVVTAFTSEVYKQKFPTLLNANLFDVLYWHAGERLYKNAQLNNSELAKGVMPIIDAFLHEPDITKTSAERERVRLQHSPKL